MKYNNNISRFAQWNYTGETVPKQFQHSWVTLLKVFTIPWHWPRSRGGICPCRHCRRQCKIFASGVNFSIFTHFLCFFLLKLLKVGEIDGVKFLAWKSWGVKFWTNSMSAKIRSGASSWWALQHCRHWRSRGRHHLASYSCGQVSMRTR